MSDSMHTKKFSYSKLSTYDKTAGGCPWRYKLQYVDKHFVDTSSIANEFGTLVHFVEEVIANDIIANDNEPNFMIDDNKYIDLFINADIHSDKETILGVKKLKEKYPNDFYVKDKSGMDYSDKANDYLNYGIFRLRDYLAENRHIRVVGCEIPFNVEYRGYIFNGFVDRLLYNSLTNEYIIEDIKTWTSIDGHNLTTPLQFIFYTKAIQELYHTENILCKYDLPLVKSRYAAGTSGYMKRGLNKIDKLLDLIESEEFEPNPSPLCHWCVFSKTYPNQPEEAKNLCPYYCNWTKDVKDFSVDFEWMGLENHDAIMQQFIKLNDNNKSNITSNNSIAEKIDKDIFDNNRFFILRR